MFVSLFGAFLDVSSVALQRHLVKSHVPVLDASNVPKGKLAKWTVQYGILPSQANAFALYIRDMQRLPHNRELIKILS
ncbi:unnamed protein product [Sympodiomycopsis kandeliae]